MHIGVIIILQCLLPFVPISTAKDWCLLLDSSADGGLVDELDGLVTDLSMRHHRV